MQMVYSETSLTDCSAVAQMYLGKTALVVFCWLLFGEGRTGWEGLAGLGWYEFLFLTKGFFPVALYSLEMKPELRAAQSTLLSNLWLAGQVPGVKFISLFSP